MEFNDWKQFCADIQARVKDGYRVECYRLSTLLILVRFGDEFPQRFDYALIETH